MPGSTARSWSARLIEHKDYAFGYDAQKEEYGDLYKLGIIDPTKVVRTALQDAASDRRPSHHHRGDGRREAEKGNPRPRDAGRRDGLLSAAAGLKARRPNLAFVSSGFSNRPRRTITMQKERSFTGITWKRVPSGQRTDPTKLFQADFVIRVSKPFIRFAGVGGQPERCKSTGMTAETPPTQA